MSAIIVLSSLASQLAYLVRKIMSTGSVTGRLWRITSTHCQMTDTAAEQWDAPFSLDAHRREVVFWKNNIHSRNLRCFFFFSVFQELFKIILLCDAYSCSAVIYNNDGEHVCHKMWSEGERGKSSM